MKVYWVCYTRGLIYEDYCSYTRMRLFSERIIIENANDPSILLTTKLTLSWAVKKKTKYRMVGKF